MRLGGFGASPLALFIPSGYIIGILLGSDYITWKIDNHLNRVYCLGVRSWKPETFAALKEPKLG